MLNVKSVVAQGSQCINAMIVGSVPSCGNEIYDEYFYFCALVTRQSVALSSTTQHAMPPKLGGKWGKQLF